MERAARPQIVEAHAARSHASAGPDVTHVTAVDLSAARRRVLDDLRADNARAAPDRRRLVHLGRLDSLAGVPVDQHVRTSWSDPWFGAARLRSAVETTAGQVCHVWTRRALRACAALGDAAPPLLVEFDLDDDPIGLARLWQTLPARQRERSGVVCRTGTAQRRLIEHGLTAAACPVVREGVNFGEINAASRETARAALGLDASQWVVLMLPPVSRCAGALDSLWAVLLAYVVRMEIRVVVPPGSDAARVWSKACAVRKQQALVRAPAAMSLVELLAACDVAIISPASDVGLGGLPWAMAAGKPILASATHCVAEFLADRHNGWLVRPGDPRTAARKLLMSLESPAASREIVARARGQAYDVFARSRMLAQYRAIYGSLAAGRPAATGVEDSALIR
ncbi:MAG: hypothetical protein CHACPFDD_03679 [Phycisphaerae bacterium]|nr:hypothetical protein [Phycisphaerae bacterium]